jgi:flavin-dependent thymidylate synthase
MKVELISYTPDAVELLIYTKSTRLQADTTLDDIRAWPEHKKMEHLEYMRGTIRSSWEFVDYVFKVSGVTRAFTHQLVRTRTGSYAQESQRTVPPKDGVLVPPNLVQSSIKGEFSDRDIFGQIAADALKGYEYLVDERGVSPQDARGILPTNTMTSIIVKWNLRTIHDTAKLRLCVRTQGEYQQVFKEMRRLIIEVHPWAEDFIQVFCVAHSHCMFPHYADCPIKQRLPDTFDQDQFDSKRIRIEEVWEETDHEATPRLVGKEGMTK